MGRAVKFAGDVVDSCILIDYLNGEVKAQQFLDSMPALGISPITWMEVMAGVPAQNEQQVTVWLERFTVLPVDEAVMVATVKLRKLKKLKLPDAIIAATGEVHDCVIHTRDIIAYAALDKLSFKVNMPYTL